MRLVDRLLSRASVDTMTEYSGSGAYLVSSSDPSGRYREGVPAGIVRTAREAYEQNGIVFACVAARAALFSEARFALQSTVDKHQFGNSGLSLLEYPWPNADAGELLKRMELDVSTAGNSYIRKVQPEDGSDPLLVQMRPDCVTIVSEERYDDAGRMYKVPVGYAEDLVQQGYANRPPQFYSVDEVAHYSPDPDPSACWRGMSWLTPVLREISADNAMTAYKTVHLQRGAMPGMVVKYSQKLSQPAVDWLKKRFDALFGGPENSGRTLVLDEGADVTVAGSTLEQLQYVSVQAAGGVRILAAAAVPTEVIGLEGPRSASGDYELAIRRFADMWAREHWRMCCASLQHLVTLTNPQTGETGPITRPTRLWYDVSDIAALREGELARGQTVLVKAQAVASFVTAGYTRESAIAAAESGDLSQLKADPAAAPPGAPTGTRAPQAALPQDLPGVVAPNKPNALPGGFSPMPLAPNGSARG